MIGNEVSCVFGPDPFQLGIMMVQWMNVKQSWRRQDDRERERLEGETRNIS